MCCLLYNIIQHARKQKKITIEYFVIRPLGKRAYYIGRAQESVKCKPDVSVSGNLPLATGWIPDGFTVGATVFCTLTPDLVHRFQDFTSKIERPRRTKPVHYGR